MQAIILAGGKGRRLLPYTTVLPKPLMPIGDFSILEIILRQLIKAGFDDIVISTGYLSELICAFINSREDLNGSIRFSHETTPLSTIAPLKQIKDLNDNFLVMNGDVLTDLDYITLYNYHKNLGGIATIATYSRDVHIDFGVLHLDPTNKIKNFVEKPTYHFDVSMGVNIFEHAILDFVPEGLPFGFDDMMYSLTKEQSSVYSYQHQGYWLDIGRPDDYNRAIEEFEKNKDKFLP
jgi:NDP-sugar pyrophosphorylase family protein